MSHLNTKLVSSGILHRTTSNLSSEGPACSQIKSRRNYMTVSRTNRQIERDGAAPYEHHEIDRRTVCLKQFCGRQVARCSAFADCPTRAGWSGFIGDALRTQCSCWWSVSSCNDILPETGPASKYRRSRRVCEWLATAFEMRRPARG